MADVLSEIPLLGWGTVVGIAAVAVVCLILAILLWRKHKVWRWVFVALFSLFGLAAVDRYLAWRPGIQRCALSAAAATICTIAAMTFWILPGTASLKRSLICWCMAGCRIVAS